MGEQVVVHVAGFRGVLPSLPERPQCLAERINDVCRARDERAVAMQLAADRGDASQEGLPTVRRTQCRDEATGAVVVVETRRLAPDGPWRTTVYPADAPPGAESPAAAVAAMSQVAAEAGSVHDEAIEMVRLALASTTRARQR